MHIDVYKFRLKYNIMFLNVFKLFKKMCLLKS